MGDELSLPPVPDVQLRLPELGETLFPAPPWKRRLLGGSQLHLDLPPEFDFAESLEFLRLRLSSSTPPAWSLQPAWLPAPQPAWLTAPTPPAKPNPWVAPPKPPEPQTP